MVGKGQRVNVVNMKLKLMSARTEEGEEISKSRSNGKDRWRYRERSDS